MELEVDPRVLLALKVTAIILGAVLALWIVVSAVNFIGSLFAPIIPQPEKPVTPATQLEYLNWSICGWQKDAVQMYIQNPDSNHPSVLALKRNIELFNKVAEETGKAKFSLDDCGKQP